MAGKRTLGLLVGRVSVATAITARDTPSVAADVVYIAIDYDAGRRDAAAVGGAVHR